MRKLNNKGYMLVEIIMAFVITFALIYFLMDIVISLKNKNDDLLVDTVIKTDQTIISNKLMDYIIEDTSDENDIKFSCDKIIVDGNTVKYGDNIIGIVDDSASISYDETDERQCSNINGRIHINIPVEVKQMSDKNYNIVVDYRYKLMYCNPTKSYKCKDSSGNWKTFGNDPYTFEYDGYCEVTGDEDNWKIKFLSSGTFTSDCDMMVDIFLVGGGGGGGQSDDTESSDYDYGGGGGGGGYTVTGSYLISSSNEEGEKIVIGNGGASASNGGDTIAFGTIAKGGIAGNKIVGGSGGSGGGAGGYGRSNDAGNGGSDGSNGVTANGGAGSGQGNTTCEFGVEECSSDLLYSGGGGGGAGFYKDEKWDYHYSAKGNAGSGGGGSGGTGSAIPGSGIANTGGGGGGGSKKQRNGAPGGSGIVVIRNARTAKRENMPNFRYSDGYYLYSDDGNGNWKIKFLTSGTLTMYENVYVDTFLVGGGGGGGKSKIAATDSHNIGGGGGGGGKTMSSFANLVYGKEYKIIVGEGGISNTNGNPTSAFNFSVDGGTGGSGGAGGSGGSGGGGGGQGNSSSPGSGGTKGSNGNNGYSSGGQGQGSTTCEFGIEECSSDLLYSGGGGGGAGGTKQPNYRWNTTGVGANGDKGGIGSRRGVGASAPPNGGGGGGGGARKADGGQGGSGIVIIRKSENVVEPVIDFDYTGGYIYIDDGDGDWRIRFLTSGILTVNEILNIDAFLVGGGGGGAKSYASTKTHYYGGGGGGGGYTLTKNNITLYPNDSYEIIVGTGGETEIDGTSTIAFGETAKGGLGSTNVSGGKGASGGGSGGEGTNPNGGNGGEKGGDGSNGYSTGGSGVGATTCEFGVDNCSSDLLYAGGGGGGAGARLNEADYSVSVSGRGVGGAGGGGNGGRRGIGGDGIQNTGGGGGGGSYSKNAGGKGGSGIVVIRSKR